MLLHDDRYETFTDVFLHPGYAKETLVSRDLSDACSDHNLFHMIRLST